MQIHTSKPARSGSGCLTVFGLFFLVPGLLVGFFALKNLTQNLQAGSWEPVDASILSANLKVNYGDDSTTYKATGKFSYRYEGTEYVSEKLYFGGGSDNIGSFHQDLIRKMNNAQSKNKSMQAWVNPKNHSEAILIRDIRWGMFGFMMIFPLIFGGAGAGMIYWGRHSEKVQAKESEYQALYPEEPWMWQEEWQSNTIKSSNKTALWFSVIFATFWNLISAPILFIVPTEVLDKQNYAALIGLLFPLVGIGLAAWAIRNYRQWKKFGTSDLVLNDMPVRLGKSLRATLLIPSELPHNSECVLNLECVHQYTSGSGDDRTTREEILWQDQQRLNVGSANANGNSIPLVFKIPKDLPESEQSSSRDGRHFWRLSAVSELSGVDYSANFEIPVFNSQNNELSNEAEYEENFFSELADDEANIDSGEWIRLNLQHEQTVQGSQYTFARARLKSMCFTLSLMASIFGGIGTWLLVSKESVFIGAVFSLFGFFMLWGALHQWLYKSQFTVVYNKLSLRAGWFMQNKNDFQSHEIKKIYKHSSMSSGNVKYYGVYIDTPEKQKIKLAENLIGNRDVDSLINKISAELGLKPSS